MRTLPPGSWPGRQGPLPGRLSVVPSRDEKRVRAQIKDLNDGAEFTIVDLEGAKSLLNAHVLAASDLVIIPMGDEQQDAEAAIETLAEVRREMQYAEREIAVRILFARTEGEAKSCHARSLNQQMRNSQGSFTTELNRRIAFSALSFHGGSLWDMDPEAVTGLAKAIAQAEIFTEELKKVLAREVAEARSRTSLVDPMTQMSLRLPASVYAAFRSYCEAERRTNGEMLEEMLKVYGMMQRHQREVL